MRCTHVPRGQPEVRGRWDLHHIVEGQHFADVDFTGSLTRLYKEALPVVLIHKDEHVGVRVEVTPQNTGTAKKATSGA